MANTRGDLVEDAVRDTSPGTAGKLRRERRQHLDRLVAWVGKDCLGSCLESLAPRKQYKSISGQRSYLFSCDP